MFIGLWAICMEPTVEVRRKLGRTLNCGCPYSLLYVFLLATPFSNQLEFQCPLFCPWDEFRGLIALLTKHSSGASVSGTGKASTWALHNPAWRAKHNIMAAFGTASNLSGNFAPDCIVMMLNAYQRMGNLMQNRVAYFRLRCFPYKKTGKRNLPSAIVACTCSAHGIVQTYRPVTQAMFS